MYLDIYISTRFVYVHIYFVIIQEISLRDDFREKKNIICLKYSSRYRTEIYIVLHYIGIYNMKNQFSICFFLLLFL